MKRDDLQGIRGLAIGAVLAFHFFPKWFPNGYIGVDMFFVLSGFLMTMIFGSKPITSDSVYLFYFRRAKRILPLYLFIIFLGCFFVFLAFPNTFFPLNMDSAWTATFLYHNMAKQSDSNLYFKMLNQADDIFTHTWSLCVEMQFYLLAPIIFSLMAFCKTGISLTIFHSILIISSLGAHIFSSDQVAFNNVFCRVWQFSIGSVVFYLSNQLIELDTKVHKYTELLLEEPISENEKEILSEEEEVEDDVVFSTKPRQNLSRPSLYMILWISLTLLTVMSFSPFVIPAVILRITCTVLSSVVILVGTSCETNPMKNRILVYIGDISYSLYLVHWPIYVYVKYYYENQISVYLLAILISITLAIVITETFEKWYLKLGKLATILMIILLFLSILVIVLERDRIANFVENIKYNNEVKTVGRVSNKYENITLDEAIALNKKWARDEYKILTVGNCHPNKTLHGFCEFDKANLTGSQVIYLVGNSLTPNIAPLVYKTFKNHAKTMYMYSYTYCEILSLMSPSRCRKAQQTYIDKVSEKNPDVLFMLDRPDKLRLPIKEPIETDAIFKEALETLRKFEKIAKHKIYMMGSYTPPLKPRLAQFAEMLEKRENVTQATFEVDRTYLNGVRRQEELVKRCPKCELIRISDILFNGNKTKSFDDKTKLGYYYNGLHITPFAMNLIEPLFQNASDHFQ
ncbi:unnamed protein product [Caenorhabditis brenneri]